MVIRRSAATARNVVCVAAFYFLGCCAASVPVNSPANTANETRALLADQSKIAYTGVSGEVYNVTGKRFAYNALIQIVYSGTNQPVGTVCTGTLISNSHVLTAAHCCVTFDSFKYIEEIYIIVGANKLDYNTVTAGTGGWRGKQEAWVGKATAWHVPPGFYNASTGVIEQKWGVCVLHLHENVTRATATTAHIDDFMMIEGMGNYRALPFPSEVQTYGWGSQNNANPLQASQRLKGLRTSTVSCGGDFAGSWEPLYEPSKDHEGAPHFFCTEGSLASGALCNNDEGGPLIRVVPNHLYNLVGAFAYRIGGNDTHCVADMAGGLNLNVYVNTMAPKIYNFITAYTKPTLKRGR